MLTVFTPTYNRSNTINRVYMSLCNQTSLDFEWLIVDDGSTDGTEELVISWQLESLFHIRYIKQPNGGKYRAYNKGLMAAQGEFFFCVDSDDLLPANAVELIMLFAETLRERSDLAGVVALKAYQNGQIIGNLFVSEGTHKSLYDLECCGEGGERSLVFKTSIAKMFPFPEETDEKFVTESVIYDRFHGKFNFIISNDVLTICEYQPGGLSSDPRRLMLQNPAGYKLYYAQRIDMASTFVDRFLYALRYHAFRLLYDGVAYEYDGKYKFLVTILSPLGILGKLYYSRVK